MVTVIVTVIAMVMVMVMVMVIVAVVFPPVRFLHACIFLPFPNLPCFL
jgi:hypothetical protein